MGITIIQFPLSSQEQHKLKMTTMQRWIAYNLTLISVCFMCTEYKSKIKDLNCG